MIFYHHFSFLFVEFLSPKKFRNHYLSHNANKVNYLSKLLLYFISSYWNLLSTNHQISNTSFAIVDVYHMKYVFIPMNILQRTTSYMVSYYHIIRQTTTLIFCRLYELWVKISKYGSLLIPKISYATSKLLRDNF